MTSKRALQRYKEKQKQIQLRAAGDIRNIRPIGLQLGEIGVIFDPKNPARVHSYMLPDGERFTFDNSTVPHQTPPIEPSLMATSMGNRGERNTLAYRFGEMLLMAEDLFGPRNISFLFLGFEFVPDHARVRYLSDYALVIQLSFRAMRDPLEAYFELAHECVHLLSPHPYIPVKIIEEGMADWFSRTYIRERVGVPITAIKQARYDEAGALVGKLLEIDRYGIRKMREEEPDTRKISKSLILKYYPNISEEIAARLSRTFLNGVKDTPNTIQRYISEVVASE